MRRGAKQQGGPCVHRRRVLLTHYKPDRTDDALDELAARFRATPQVTVAAEGHIITL
jgi:hypothetical protein